VAVDRKRRRYHSSSSSSEEDVPDRRQADSSSDDDSEIDQRRKRLVQQRAKERVENSSSSDDDDDKIKSRRGRPPKGSSSEEEERRAPTTEDNKKIASDNASRDKPQSAKPLSTAKGKPRPSSSSSSSEEESGSSSEEESSEEEEEANQITRPVFIPKHKRGKPSAEEEEAKQELQEHEKLEQLQKRKQESRALVQQVVAATAKVVPNWDSSSGMEGLLAGARNDVPDDSDDTTDRDAWEVRELMRLIEDWDIEEDRVRDEKDLAHRRRMTDDERLQEDIADGRYRRPGEKPKDGDDNPQGRYFHKGAFYMDESEWDQSDVRKKADEYAKAATGSDKIDKNILPEVMRVKKFGLANQSKYKGLAAEDTTDRQARMLPLAREKKGSNR
jgi:microfibrillar-associated protein 1